METAEILERVGLTLETLRDYCDHWQIIKFSLFGSILRDDFIVTPQLCRTEYRSVLPS